MTLGNILINKLRKFKENIIKAIPTPNNETPLSDVNNGNKGKSPNYARSDHQHPKSTLYAEASHTHSQYYTKEQINDLIGDIEEDMNS